MAHQQQHHQTAQPQSSKPLPALDWLSFPAPAAVDAPHPDLFDFELDNSLSAFDQAQVQLLHLDYNTNADAFQYYRSETPQGPPSVITASSESAYETLSQHSESLYNYSNPSPSQYGGVESSYSADLALDFSAFNVHSADMPALISLLDPLRSGKSDYSYNGRYDVSASRSTHSASGTGYAGTGAIAPQHTASTGHRASSADSPKSSDGAAVAGDTDRKKYACQHCTRSFARAYNLKTHMATHDSHRMKPYVCTHRACGRSFSRKHDLGRHLVSIHRDETGSQYSVASGHSTASERSHAVGLGAEKAVRTWCDGCGRSFLGPQRSCNCNDVK